MKIIKIILNILKYLFIVIASLFVVITVYQRVMPNNSIFGYRTYVIVSNSMAPMYEIGDMIISKEVEASEIKLKDVIVYFGVKGEYQGKVITHQVEEIYKELDNYSFTTRGIANTVVDNEPVEYNQIYGKVVYKFKLISLISKLVRNKYGALACIIFPMLFIMGLEFKELKEKILNLKEEN